MVHRTLQTPNARRSRRRKRGRVGLGYPSSAAAMAEWKPTLCSIAEDNVVLVEERTERVVKRKGSGGRRSGGSREVANVSNYNDYDRRSNQFTVIPTFSASPFMI
ncbi:hypothetical protein GH714_008644 [Hevea brasiliensis]|uniref:Uncharacterized protein n=1 Tax=Hevea brasiliensis TaxID=3981 RepID=A0A6A6KCM2_HEVBR|nr:hypothetical protein GH714_008644 [Hevea brasiliensis]